MKIELQHEFYASVGSVEDALVDARFWAQLRLPDVALPVVVGSGADHIELAMEWAGTLDALGRRIAGTDQVTWSQTIDLDRSSHRGTLSIVSSLRVDVSCRGTFRLEPTADGTSTRRTFAGELKVKVPFVGGQAERKLAPGIRSRLDAEAAALADWLAVQS
jgi:hypothetical protein